MLHKVQETSTGQFSAHRRSHCLDSVVLEIGTNVHCRMLSLIFNCLMLGKADRDCSESRNFGAKGDGKLF